MKRPIVTRTPSAASIDFSQLRGLRAAYPPDRRQKPLLSVEEAAELLGYSRPSLYRAISLGQLPLPVFHIGGRIRIPRKAVEKMIEGELMDEFKPDGHRPETATATDGRDKSI